MTECFKIDSFEFDSKFEIKNSKFLTRDFSSFSGIFGIFMSKLVAQNHPALHQITEEVPVEDISSSKIRKIIKDMREALHTYDAEGFTGVAIAAPQIGVPLRIFL